MKTILINASPRKDWNTAQLLRSAQKGAESVGAETEYVDLYDLSFTGCRSCLACKRKGAERNKCYWNDDLAPLIDRILHADAVIIGSPIYMGAPTAHFRALYERLAFCTLSYDEGEPSTFDGKVNMGFLYTMNAPKEYYEENLRPALEPTECFYGLLLHGKVQSMAACDTLQVSDYSKYNMNGFDEEEKRQHHNKQFPADLETAFQLGAVLSRENRG